MADKITPTPLTSMSNETAFLNTLNNNFTDIATKIDTLVSRDGDTPNVMEADLDLNGKRLFNLPLPMTDSEPLRRGDSQIGPLLAELATATQLVSDASGYALAASGSASSAGSSASTATQAAIDAVAAKDIIVGLGQKGRLVDVRVFSAAGSFTWTKPSGLTVDAIVEVEGVAAGGSGARGGASTAGNTAGATGGGGGSYFKGYILASALGSTEPVVVGVGGVAPSGAQLDGNNGGDCYFGTLSLRIYGGRAGVNVPNSNVVACVRTLNGGIGAATSAGWFNYFSVPGCPASSFTRVSGTVFIPSDGGNSMLGIGAPGQVTIPPVFSYMSFGGGSAGQCNSNGSSGGTSEVGNNGLIIVRTYA